MRAVLRVEEFGVVKAWGKSESKNQGQIEIQSLMVLLKDLKHRYDIFNIDIAKIFYSSGKDEFEKIVQKQNSYSNLGMKGNRYAGAVF